MANIEQNICDAIELITNNAISKAGFDRTIQATIVACMNEATGKYKIKYQDSLLYAYSPNVEKRYNKGNRVYVLIPGNDTTKDKTILGIVGESQEYVTTEYGDIYEIIGNDFIKRQALNGYNIYSGTRYNFDEANNKNSDPSLCERYGKVIYQSDAANVDCELISNVLINEYLEKTEFIKLQANFRTQFKKPVTEGEYGLRVLIQCRDPQDSNNKIYYPIDLDFSHGIDGEFYSFNVEGGFKKYWYFQKPNNFEKIYRIEFFAKNFEAQSEEADPSWGIPEENVTSDDYDINVSKISMFAAVKVTETSGLRIVYPGGNALLRDDIRDSLEVKVEVYDDGKLMSDSANEFYWFQQDLSVKSVQSGKYCDLGGLNWACLNSKDKSGNWIPHSNNFIFEENKYLLSYKTRFKIVSYRKNGSKIIKYEKEFELLNEKSNINVSIIANPGDFPLARTQILNLVCNIDRPDDGQTHTYRYFWSSHIGNIEYTHDSIKTAPFYKIGETQVISNQINNIYLNGIFTYYNDLSFSCTIQERINNKNVTLCTANIAIPLADATSPLSYDFQIVNGTQNFIYDEYGDSPSKNGTYTPPPLTLRLIDKAGNEINLKNEILAGNLTIKWEIPKPDSYTTKPDSITLTEPATLIDAMWDEIFNGYCLKVNYTLKSPYKYNNLDSNIIKAIITYNGIVFERSTNFNFLPQGMAGTNGTSYSAVIVPNGNVDKPKWVTFNTTWDSNQEYSDEGYFNFGSTPDNYYYIDSTGSHLSDGGADFAFPFKVIISGGGNTIFDGSTPTIENGVAKGIDIYGNDIEITWDMGRFTYNGTNNFISDRSNFLINTDNNILKLKYKNLLYDYSSYSSNKDRQIYDRAGNEFVPANILQCRIKYTDNTKVENVSSENKDVNNSTEFYLYASIPIVKIVNEENSSFALDIKQSDGYTDVIYNRDGCKPQYDNNSNYFTIIGKDEQSQTILENNFSACSWEIKGHNGFYERKDARGTNEKYVYKNIKNLFITEIRTEGSSETTTKTNTIKIDPAYEFNGSSITNAILFIYNDNNHNNYIHIPVDIYLNRYGLAMLNGWDGNSIQLDKDGGFILAPQVGAGYKENDNSFTGIVLGQAKESTQTDTHTGLYGYYKGQRSFGVYAESGITTIGMKGSSQIIINPEAEKGIIYSGNLFKSDALDPDTGVPKKETLDKLDEVMDKGATGRNNPFRGDGGLLIDFTDGNIYYGNDKFRIDSQGNIRSQEGHFSNDRYSLFPRYDKVTHIELDRPINKRETCFVDLKKYTDPSDENYEEGDEYFLYCYNKNSSFSNPKPNFSVTKDGQITANLGKIGGFHISDSYISSHNDVTIPFYQGKSIITMSTNPFTRYFMNIVSAGKRDPEDPDVIIPIRDITNLINDDDFSDVYLRRNIGLENILFATGDDFAVTEDGSLYTRNVFAQGAIFTSLGAENLVVTEDVKIDNNLEVKEEALINDLTTTERLKARGGVRSYNIQTESIDTTSITNELYIGADYIINGNTAGSYGGDQLFWGTYGVSDPGTAALGLAPGEIYLVYDPNSTPV